MDNNYYVEDLISAKNINNSILITALNSLDLGIVVNDMEGKTIYANKKYLYFFSIEDSSKEICEQLNTDRLDAKRIINELSENINAVEGYQRVYKYIYNLLEYEIHGTAYPIIDEKNKMIGIIQIFKKEKLYTSSEKNTTPKNNFTFENIAGVSYAIQSKIEIAKLYAVSNENILITGETGTGKEMFAQSIHNFSNRKDKPFVAINCANFNQNLIDSELFGYDEGAFTGGLKSGKKGKFEIADGGTLMLDEIGEMPYALQAKLLRVIETGKITPLGGNREIDVDVRIIAVTNRNLEDMKKQNLFRKDLYYRLSVLKLHIPPLRDRKEDIPYLIDVLYREYAQYNDKTDISPGVYEIYNHYDWPGNVRELENHVAKGVVQHRGKVVTKEDIINDFEDKIKNINNFNSNNNLFKIPKDLLVKTLKDAKGNKAQAAKILKVSRQTIYKYLKLYNINNSSQY